jgi:SHOCT-like protein
VASAAYGLTNRKGEKDMSAEIRKILEMLAQGKISAADAERLFDKLSSAPSALQSEAPAGPAPATGEEKPRHLRIQVDGPEKSDVVNIRVPLSFLRTGLGLVAVLPPRVNQKLAEKGIDLSALSNLKGEEFIQALRELNMDIESHDGKKVRIFCE